MEEGRQQKRRRLFLPEPAAIINNVLQLSQSPFAVNEEPPIDIDFAPTDIKSFFNDDFSVLPEYKIAPYVKTALQNGKASEEQLRDAIFTDLQENHGIKFASSSKPAGFSKVFQALFSPKIKKYNETSLESVLEEFAKETYKVDISAQNVRVSIKTASKPDLASTVTRGWEPELLMGEFKNASHHDTKAAKIQCARCLLNLLYFLRVKLGKPVETVYGFYFCGSQCRDQYESYAVGLIRLSAPQYLGECIKAECAEFRDGLHDTRSLHLLIHFLKEGKGQSYAGYWIQPVERRVPSLYILPTSLWTDQDGRKLVLHGSTSIVFRLSGHSLVGLLLDESSPHFKQYMSHNDMYWWDWYTKTLSGALAKTGLEKPYVLKIRSKDMCFCGHPMIAMREAWDAIATDEGIRKVYPLPPFVSSNFGLVVMHDCGRLLVKSISLFLDMSTIAEQFKKIMGTAMFLAETLPHGDVLPHNIVFNVAEGTLCLIDVDEGIWWNRFNSFLLRHNVYSGNEDQDWHAALSYPNLLREHATLYTQVQLIVTFLFLMKQFKLLSAEMAQMYERLQILAKEIGLSLLEQDKRCNAVRLAGTRERWLRPRIERAFKDMKTILDVLDSE